LVGALKGFLLWYGIYSIDPGYYVQHIVETMLKIVWRAKVVLNSNDKTYFDGWQIFR
jgi:hypothetical protein